MTRRYVDFTDKVDNKDLKFRIYEPTLEDQRNANKARNEAFNDAISSKAPLRSQLTSRMRDNGTWTKEQDEQFEKLSREINDAEKKLAEGGFSLTEAKQLAIDVRRKRLERRALLSEMSQLDNNTAEGQADNMAFNYLVSACTMVYNENGKEEKYFADLNDYLNRSTSDIAFSAATKLSSLIYGIGDDVEKALPENKFLVDFGFATEDLKLVDGQGRLVDEEGRLINEDGHYIDEQGNLTDRDGNPVNEDGSFKVEFKGFLDDSGNVVMGKSKSEASVDEKVKVSEE